MFCIRLRISVCGDRLGLPRKWRVINICIYIHLSYFRKLLRSVDFRLKSQSVDFFSSRDLERVFVFCELCVTCYSKQNANFANNCRRAVAYVATTWNASKRQRVRAATIKDTGEAFGIFWALAALLVSSFIISTGHLHLPHIRLCFPGEWAIKPTCAASFVTLQWQKNANIEIN